MVNTPRTWTRRLMGLAVIATMGCGSLGGNSSSGSGSGSGGADKTIKIGLHSILSGPAATAGTGTDAGVQAYLKKLNEKGGINGYKFTFNEQDNGYNPAQSATVGRTLIDDRVFAIVSEGTEPLKALAPLTSAANIPVFSETDGATLTPPTKPFDHVYGVNPVYTRVAAQGAVFIADTLKETRAALVYLNFNGEVVAKDAFPAMFKSRGGTVVDVESIEVKTNDYAPFVQKLKASNAPVVYTFILDSQVAAIQKAAAAIGYNPKWVAWFFGYTPGYVKLAGNLAAGSYVSQFQWPLSDRSDAGVQAYLEAMKQYYPSEIDSPTAEQGWTFGAIIARGVTEATKGGKKLTTEAFTAALDNINGERLGLISITYNSQTHAGASKSGYYQIQADGSLKTVAPYAELPPPPAG